MGRGQLIPEESVAKLAAERLLKELEKQVPRNAFRFEDIVKLPSTKEILAANAPTQLAFVHAAVD